MQAPERLRVFHLGPDRFDELAGLPEQLPASGFLWVGCERSQFRHDEAPLQAALQRWTGGQLVDLHVSDLLNEQLPSHFDSTSWYDLLVFRRLAAAQGPAEQGGRNSRSTLEAIDTSPVGFALFDRVLVSVHPSDCSVRDFFANRLEQQARTPDSRSGARLPPGSADLMLRMLNHMVDSYLDLRRRLTRDLAELQAQLLHPHSHFADWRILLDLRNGLHLLEDTCEDQRAAVTEWIDALDEWPVGDDAGEGREHELLRVRSRDVLEHVERVLAHVRRLEGSADAAVQMHFSAQSHRTNNIMRTLTVLTAIFLPLNLVTGFFGMNFDRLPLIHSSAGFWAVAGLLVLIALATSLFFWRKRYLSNAR
jgi:magnesium transporter